MFHSRISSILRTTKSLHRNEIDFVACRKFILIIRLFELSELCRPVLREMAMFICGSSYVCFVIPIRRVARNFDNEETKNDRVSTFKCLTSLVFKPSSLKYAFF